MLTVRAFLTAAGFGFLIEFAKPINIIHRSHEENSLDARANSCRLASGGIITDSPILSTEWTTLSGRETSESCAIELPAILFSLGRREPSFRERKDYV